MKLRWGQSIVVVMLGMFALSASFALATKPPTPAQAEYAIRWNVTDSGGPDSAKDTLEILKTVQDDSTHFEVRYFDFTRPPDAPEGFAAILRQRTKVKKHELTFKYRGDQPLPVWRCPLSPTPDETKNEVDISVIASGEPRRVHSASCSVESKDAPITPPAELKAQLKRCVSTMIRLKVGKLKVEEWHLASGTTLIEASRAGVDTPEDLKKFLEEVADPLIRDGVIPTDSSKTDLGGTCD